MGRCSWRGGRGSLAWGFLHGGLGSDSGLCVLKTCPEGIQGSAGLGLSRFSPFWSLCGLCREGEQRDKGNGATGMDPSWHCHAGIPAASVVANTNYFPSQQKENNSPSFFQELGCLAETKTHPLTHSYISQLCVFTFLIHQDDSQPTVLSPSPPRAGTAAALGQ